MGKDAVAALPGDDLADNYCSRGDFILIPLLAEQSLHQNFDFQEMWDTLLTIILEAEVAQRDVCIAPSSLTLTPHYQRIL